MKKVFAILSAIVLMAFTVQAQRPGLYDQIAGGTNYVAAATTNSYATTTQAVGDYDNVGVMFAALGADASATNTLTLVGYKQTGNEWDTDPYIRLPLTMAGASRKIASTNLALYTAASIGKWKIEWATTNSYCTNLTVQVRLLRKVVDAK